VSDKRRFSLFGTDDHDSGNRRSSDRRTSEVPANSLLREIADKFNTIERERRERSRRASDHLRSVVHDRLTKKRQRDQPDK
jgi:hypothetical protein